MGRRSLHSPEQLRQLILTASRNIIETQGLTGLSAREIARVIGYSPGTLYNIFENLDDVLLTLQVILLTGLVEAMEASPANADPQQRIDTLAQTYLRFALQNKQLWNLLLAHYPAEGVAMPPALHDRVNEIVAIFVDGLHPLVAERGQKEIDLAARALLGGVHGLTSIAITAKGPMISATNAELYVRTLTSTFVRGLARS